MSAAAWIIGVHLATAHAAPGLELHTAGVYAVAPGGLTAGALRNSHGRGSLYLAHTWQRGPWGLTAGAITGYPARPVLPMLVPSVRVPLGSGAAARLSYLPRVPRYGSSAAVHLSLEFAR
jgi:hypothetical protein